MSLSGQVSEFSTSAHLSANASQTWKDNLGRTLRLQAPNPLNTFTVHVFQKVLSQPPQVRLGMLPQNQFQHPLCRERLLAQGPPDWAWAAVGPPPPGSLAPGQSGPGTDGDTTQWEVCLVQRRKAVNSR